MAKIPPFPRAEYEAAVSSEQSDRYLAFLGIERIAGISVAPLTLRRLAWLNVVKSPFIVGGAVDAPRILQFIWHVSHEFSLDENARNAFIAAHATIDLDRALTDINDYVDRAFLDCATGSPRGTIIKTVASTCASVCLQMAEEPFRMSWVDAMDVPLAVLFQLLKVKSIREGAPKVNKRSDKIAARHNERMNAIMQKEKAKKMKEKEKQNG